MMNSTSVAVVIYSLLEFISKRKYNALSIYHGLFFEYLTKDTIELARGARYGMSFLIWYEFNQQLD